MRTAFVFALGILCLAGAPQDDKGTVSGVIEFTGDVPEMPVIDMKSTDFCKNCHKEDVREEDVLVKDGKLQNVLVYLKKGVKGKFEVPKEKPLLDQKNCIYTPHVLIVHRKQAFRIRSSDKTPHNVAIKSDRNGNENISMADPMEVERTFNTPEVGVRVKCDVHPWMGAWVHVMRHPYYQLTAKDGKYKLEGFKPGKYTLAAWHERYGEKTKVIEVGEGKTVEVKFSFSEKDKK